MIELSLNAADKGKILFGCIEICVVLLRVRRVSFMHMELYFS